MCISLMDDIQHLLTCLFTGHKSSLVRYLFESFAHIAINFCSFAVELQVSVDLLDTLSDTVLVHLVTLIRSRITMETGF